MTDIEFKGIFDEGMIRKLDELRNLHGDESYTVAIKRAIAESHYLAKERESGKEIYVGKDGRLDYLVRPSD